MPSKYSESLQQAIQYIKAGEKEIAREIILEIIQNDPDYEKAWIWLVETVPDKAGKVEILKTRLDEYPESPLTRKALEHIAPEMLNHLQTEDEAIFIPPSSHEKKVIKVEEEDDRDIQYDMSSDDMGLDRFGFDDSDLIEFEEPKKESGELFTGAGIFGNDNDDEEETSAFALMLEEEEDGEDAEEILEQDLEAFLRGGLDPEKGEKQGTSVKDSNREMSFTDWLDGDQENEEDETPVDELSFLMAQGVNSDEKTDAESTSASNPFVLSREESLALFGEDVLKESKEEIEDTVLALRSTSTRESQSAFRREDIQAFDLDDALFPEIEPPGSSGASVSADDLLELGNSQPFKAAGRDPLSGSNALRQEAKKAQKKKQPNKNHTFIWGCSVLAAIMVISLLGLAWLFFQNMMDNPPSPTATLTAAPSATATEAYTLVAPWLQETTPTPEGE